MDIKVQNGEIEIKQKSRHFKLFWFQSNDEITVILPKGVTFEKFPWIVAVETLRQIL